MVNLVGVSVYRQIVGGHEHGRTFHVGNTVEVLQDLPDPVEIIVQLRDQRLGSLVLDQ